jgi:hypothetical protein
VPQHQPVEGAPPIRHRVHSPLPGMGDTVPVGRRSLLIALVGTGLIVGVSACGSGATSTSPKPVKACSLLSGSEAQSIFALRSGYRAQQQTPTNQRSYCVYPGSNSGTYAISSVTWSPAELSRFEKAHDGRHPTTSGTLPSGESVPAPAFVKVEIDGHTAYWSARQPLPVNGTGNHPSLMTAAKNGYVVALSALGLTESQNEQILSRILGQL